MKKSLFTTFALLACLFFYQNLYGHEGELTEYDVKAAFLYNFTNFVKWPDSSFENKADTFVIGIYGENPFNGELSKIVEGEKVGGVLPIIVRQLNSIDEVIDCHIVYSNTSDKKTINQIINMLNGKSVLTVGEAKNFAKHGGMIGFVLDDGRVKFELNISVAEKVDLRINSRLQRVAKKIIK